MKNLICICLFFCSACCSNKANKKLEHNNELISYNSLINSKWSFINYIPSVTNLINVEKTATIQFKSMENNELPFNGSCFVNNYGGSLIIKDNNVIFSENFYITEKASANNLLNIQEKEFIKQLKKVSSYKIINDTLTLQIAEKTGTQAILFIKTKNN